MVDGFNHLDPMNHSTYLMNDYPATYEEALEYGESLAPLGPDSPKLRPQLTKDGYYRSDGEDDGKISFFEKTKAILKGGTYNLLKGLFCNENGFSIKRTLATALVGGAIALTGPIGLAIAGGIGTLASVVHLAKSVGRSENALTDIEARKAYEGIGEGVVSAALSMFAGFKGLSSIKNNFNIAKNSNTSVSTLDKLKKWNMGRGLAQRTTNQANG